MYGKQKILGLIPARGGSKGVPRKNIRDLAGKPLIAWTIEEAGKSRYIDRTIVSTEDLEIKSVAERFGGEVPFLRPANLAADDTPGIAPVLHAIEQLPGYDVVVLLQVTSPFRIAADIDGAIESFFAHEVSSCVSVTEAEASPYWMYTLDERQHMNPILAIDRENSYQRQRLPVVYQLNGAVYVAGTDFLQQHKGFIGVDTVGYVMPQERSYDIDTMQDFLVADVLMKNRNT